MAAIDEAYERAKKAGRGKQFLASHPQYAARLRGEDTPINSTVTDSGGQRPKLDRAYKKALAAGTQDQFLAEHPNYARIIGAASTPPVAVNPVPNPGMLTEISPRVRQGIESETAANINQGVTAGTIQNPNYVAPGGTVSTTWDPATGQATHTITDSPTQATIRTSAEGLTQTGLNKAQEALENFKTFNYNYSPEERARIEQGIFDRLTKYTTANEQREKDAILQDLYNRGIPLDPNNPLYQAYMKDYNNKYADIRSTAALDAIAAGGNEMMNAYNIALGTHQQGAQDISWLQNQGLGYQGMSDPGFVAPNVLQDSALQMEQVFAELERSGRFTQAELNNLKAQTRALNAQASRLNRPPASGGGMGSPPEAAPFDPFE